MGSNANDAPSRGPVPAVCRRYFITDLHLDGRDTPRARSFHALLRRLAQEATQLPIELYILGDLFEFWEEGHTEIAAGYERDLTVLEEAYRAGVQLVLLWGNRDFAYGRYVKNRLGARLFKDGGPVQLADTRWVWLEHGDLLCTADWRYRLYRRWVRSWPVRVAFWFLPWSAARWLIGSLRERSSADKAAKPKHVFEIDLEEARRRLDATGCKLLLCGHTHRAQATDLGGGHRLLVLPAWCDVAAGYREQGGSLQPVRFLEDGSPAPATHSGEPRPED